MGYRNKPGGMLDPRETPDPSRTANTRLFEIGGLGLNFWKSPVLNSQGHTWVINRPWCAIRAILRPQPAPSSSGRLFSFRPASLVSENETGGVFLWA